MINISDTQQLKTSVTYYGTGSQTNFDFPFDYLRKAFIHVTINDVEVSDYSIDSRTIIFETAPSEGAIINIYRSTDTTRLVSWADASVLKASDMTISQVQQLHILEEGQDWSKLNSLYLDETDNSWEGNNHKIKNVSYPVNDDDVVTKGYMETVQGGFVMTNTALKDEATKQAGIATTKASEASTSASAAKTSETNAASSASTAKRWAEASDSPDNTTSKSAKTWASEAIGSASAAKTSETNAKASETAANTSKTEAQGAATLANSYANNAKSDASLAHTYMQSSQSNMNSTKNYMDNAKNYSENVNVFFPSVSDSGVLSWTNKAGLANPASVNIKGAKGDKGDTGNAATIEVGTVTTGAAGSSASVVNRGDANNAILDFILPKGADGKGSVVTVNGKEPDANGNVEVSTVDVSSIVNIIYPVGSLYWSKNPTNPATLFGGTWTQIKDKFILAAGNTYAVGATGGSATVALTTEQMPAHSHTRGTMNVTGSFYANQNEHYTTNNGSGAFKRTKQNSDSKGSTGHDMAFSKYDFTASNSWSGSTSSVGSGSAHNNMPPYVTYYCWERTA